MRSRSVAGCLFLGTEGGKRGSQQCSREKEAAGMASHVAWAAARCGRMESEPRRTVEPRKDSGVPAVVNVTRNQPTSMSPWGRKDGDSSTHVQPCCRSARCWAGLGARARWRPDQPLVTTLRRETRALTQPGAPPGSPTAGIARAQPTRPKDGAGAALRSGRGRTRRGFGAGPPMNLAGFVGRCLAANRRR